MSTPIPEPEYPTPIDPVGDPPIDPVGDPPIDPTAYPQREYNEAPRPAKSAEEAIQKRSGQKVTRPIG